MKIGIIVLFSLVIVYLTVLAGFSTSAINKGEHTYLIADSMWRNLAIECVVLLVLGVVSFCRRRNIDQYMGRFDFSKASRVLLILTAVMGLVFVFCVQKVPGADQKLVAKVVRQWSKGDFQSMDKGGYMDIYPNQAGIVLFLYYFGRVFGYDNDVLFRIINIVALTHTIRTFMAISDMEGKSPARDAGIALLCMLFLPCVFYTTFVYGTLIGLALAMTAFKYMLCYIEDKKKSHAIASVVCIFFAIVVKQNYLIFAIAMILYLAYTLVRDRFRLHLIPLFLTVILAVGLNGTVVGLAVHHITGRSLGKGMPSLSWVSMGMKENSLLYDGWWDNNESTKTLYKDCNYDREAQREVSLEQIRERIAQFKDDPEYCIRFFAGKNASQWNNPDFQGWWINQRMALNERHELPVWLARLMTVQQYNAFVLPFLNAYQFIALFGVVLYLLLKTRDKEGFILLFITVIGGFIFHTFWEAKGQYTIVYFFLLLPISAEGYTLFVERLSDRKNLSRNPKVLSGIKIGALILLIGVAGMRCVPVLNDLFIRNEDTEEYGQYLSEKAYYIVPNGNYVMKPVLNPDYALAARKIKGGKDSTSLYLSEKGEKTSRARVRITMEVDTVTVCFSKVDRCLDVSEGKAGGEKKVWAYRRNGSPEQSWKVRHLSDSDAYCFLFDDNLALSYDSKSGSVFVSEFDGSEQQRWILKEI